MNKKEFITALYRKGIFKTGSFVLKSGLTSPFYINLREIISYPDLLDAAAELLQQAIPRNFLYDRVAGVPYTGIPIASAYAIKSGKPLIIKRKEEKVYGSKDSVLGKFSKGESSLIIEDLITTGESILETKEELESEGLIVNGAAVLIDRRSDNASQLLANGLKVFSVTTIKEITDILTDEGLMNSGEKETILSFLNSPQNIVSCNKPTGNPSTEKLKQIINDKKSRLVLSLDVNSSAEFFRILNDAAPYICMVKTHIDIMNDFSDEFIRRLRSMAKEHNFMIFEDRKFADIGSTVRMQYRNGIYKISDWSDFITVHAIAGEAILKGLFEGLENKSSFLLARMSAKDNLITENYTRKVLEMGKKNSRWVSGFIGHGKSVEEIIRLKQKIGDSMMLLMPGVQTGTEGDNIGQQYITPEIAIAGGADAIIVGRGITHSADISATAKEYRDKAWN